MTLDERSCMFADLEVIFTRWQGEYKVDKYAPCHPGIGPEIIGARLAHDNEPSHRGYGATETEAAIDLFRLMRNTESS